MRSMSRATMFFGVALITVTLFGVVMRDLLHLDCVGPYIEGWGCLATPFPATIDDFTVSTGVMARYVVALIVLFAACFILRDAAALVAAAAIRKFFPGLLRKPASAPRPSGYRYR